MNNETDEQFNKTVPAEVAIVLVIMTVIWFAAGLLQ